MQSPQLTQHANSLTTNYNHHRTPTLFDYQAKLKCTMIEIETNLKANSKLLLHSSSCQLQILKRNLNTKSVNTWNPLKQCKPTKQPRKPILVISDKLPNIWDNKSLNSHWHAQVSAASKWCLESIMCLQCIIPAKTNTHCQTSQTALTPSTSTCLHPLHKQCTIWNVITPTLPVKPPLPPPQLPHPQALQPDDVSLTDMTSNTPMSTP